MKKYIFTESQMKKILDGVIEEQILTEQMEALNAKKAIQCFLNKVVGANLKVDGLHGESTAKAIEKFQSKINGRQQFGDVEVDGVWGFNTGSSLTDKEKQIMRDCKSKHGDIIDKFLIWLGIG